LNPVIKVQAGTSNASVFPRQPSAPLCFCTSKNPTHVISKLRYFLILMKKLLWHLPCFYPGLLTRNVTSQKTWLVPDNF
jgi:hypothetical protein